MPNLLEDFYALAKPELLEKNFEVKLKQELGTSTSMRINREDFIGGICFWPPNTVEIGFLDCSTGKDVYLETKCIENVDGLFEFLSEALEKIGIT